MKFCPLIKDYCRKDCAWYHEFDDTKDTDCAIKVIADVGVSEINLYVDEIRDGELKENLHKPDKKELPN